MNWLVLRLLYVHELRMLLRARRTVVLAVVLPALVMPLMLYAQKYSANRRERILKNTVYRYAITGPLAEHVRALLKSAHDTLQRQADPELAPLLDFKFIEASVEDVRASLMRNDIQFYIETMTGDEADAQPFVPAATSSSGRPDTAAASRLAGVPLINIVYSQDREGSDNAHDQVMARLRLARRQDTHDLIVWRGFHGNPADFLSLTETDVATTVQETGIVVGRMITLFLVMMMFTGGAVASMDIISGEKERGTLETLLTTAAGRTEIVTAKQLAITSVSLVITLVQALNFLLYIKLRVIALPKNFDLELPAGTVVSLLLLFIPLAVTIASILLMISAYAKSYKESQLYFFPVYLLCLLPSLTAMLPTISLRSAIAFVPLANVSVAAREIMAGRSDPPMVAVTIGVMIAAAALLMRTSARMLTREDLILPAHAGGAEFLGGFSLFQKRVLRWFALMWVITFAVAANIPALAEFRRQLLFNEVVVMLGAVLVMLKLYGLRARDVLSLRPVRPVVWLAILFCIPSGYVTALGIFRITNVFIPAPQQLLEKFSADLIPKGMPAWQLVLYAAVLPAICEELAFRGVLLSGLRRKLKPGALIVAIGIIFGLFHVTLYRIVPTAALGMVLTSIALMTGSIFPGMLLHAGNNALGVLAGDWFTPDAFAWSHFAAAGAIFALSLWLIYRNRTCE